MGGHFLFGGEDVLVPRHLFTCGAFLSLYLYIFVQKILLCPVNYLILVYGCDAYDARKTCTCNCIPLYTPLLHSKTGVYKGKAFCLIFVTKQIVDSR